MNPDTSPTNLHLISMRLTITRYQLEHAIRAACDVSEDTALWVFGSQAILGEFPDAPKSLHATIEVDVQPKNIKDSA